MTDRLALLWTIADARARMLYADTPERKVKWARVMVAAKKERGDYDTLIQPPISEELLQAIARHEAQAVLNLDGEHND